MSSALMRPTPVETAKLAREIRDVWMADSEMVAVLDGCARYSSDWTEEYGGTLIHQYNAHADSKPLLSDAVKVMALKSAVYFMTADELAAEIPIPVPIDVTCHALMAQFTALSRIQERSGYLFVHSTVNEHTNDTPWRFGDYTHQAYRAAFGPVNERYWIDADEVERRRRILDDKYASIGITERGMASSIAYDAS
jgi:hypothetical protein